MGVATYLSPPDFLATLARRLRTTPERIPASRATEELLSWIEISTAAGVKPPLVFLHTAFRLVYEHARFVIGPNGDQIDALAERLSAMNANRRMRIAHRPPAGLARTGGSWPAWCLRTGGCP